MDIVRTIENEKLYSKRLCRHFRRACLDTGAQQIVVEERQARVHCELHNIRYKLKPPITRFKFGYGTFPSLGKIEVRIQALNGPHLKTDMEIVSGDVRTLL